MTLPKKYIPKNLKYDENEAAFMRLLCRCEFCRKYQEKYIDAPDN